MECIEARALKSSFLKNIGMKSTQQTLFEDLWCVAGIDNVVNVSCDEFSVDDLLDLSDKDFTNSHEEEEKDSMICSSFSSTGDFVSLPAGEIHLPVDDMENLEWLSQIVDHSTSELSLSFPQATLNEKTGKFVVNGHEPVTPMIPSFTVLGLSYPVPRKCRSKRSKKTGRAWSVLTDSSMDTSSSYDSSKTMYYSDPVQVFDSFSNFQKPPTKKYKKSPVRQTSTHLMSDSNGSVTQRCCTHCQIQNTPQWRTGPLGPKTLCNACGVRFKSGRLFPEYRPACSPTFSGDLHSNSHRKVLEMRKKKEREVVKPGFRSSFRSFSCSQIFSGDLHLDSTRKCLK